MPSNEIPPVPPLEGGVRGDFPGGSQPPRPRNIILVGFMGAGKSRVGRELARSTGWPLVDTDAEVQRRAGKPIHRIFADDGEAAFRALERQAVVRACQGSGQIIAMGGGALLTRTTGG